MDRIVHNHRDDREPGETQARLRSACRACDQCADHDSAVYGAFPFEPPVQYRRRPPDWRPKYDCSRRA